MLEQVVDKLYASPESLNLADNTDDVYEWYTTNNSNRELDMMKKSTENSLLNDLLDIK